MTAASQHRPSCRCGGTGLVEGAPLVSALDSSQHPRLYRLLLDCPEGPWPTPPPTKATARETGRRGVAAARAAISAQADRVLAESRVEIGGLL